MLTSAVLVFGAAAPGAADPKPTEKQLKKELSDLRKKVDRLIGDYNAKRVALAKARVEEKAARGRLVKAEADYEAASNAVRQMAGLRYQTESAMALPDMNTAALNYQLKEEQAARLARFDQVRDERQRAADAAKTLTEQLKAQAAVVAGQREDAEDLIDEIKDKLDALIPIAPGKRVGGSWAPELPSGSDNITPRMRLMRTEVEKHFDLQFPIGCYRAENSGEHPLGRACDFMMSSGGAMPSAEMKALGDSVAAWAIKNGPKLGVMYVIWQQRIYNLGHPGWRTMSDRGGITANHYDHVHISMY
ncbi:coiled-coil domain-containing protein [Microbispora sp. CA-102843]|uniref:coiled-coil domain-containing protein n=1 Tax=Microbispora sp. CA-102843 TaxID=3239952 RepID=UPI003D8F938D